MKTILAVGLAVVGTMGANAQGTTQTVVPYAYESQAGGFQDDMLLRPANRQIWLRSSYLAQQWTTPVQITHIAFRVDNGWPDYNGTIPHVDLWMTTTQTDGAALQSWEADRGTDARLLISADAVALQSPGGAELNPFGLRFQFSEPFYFDPSSGNLLIRLQTSGADQFMGGAIIDAQGFGFNNSPVWSSGYNPFIMPNPNPLGPIIEFGWIAVPEPNFAGCAQLGLVLWLFYRKAAK